MTNVTRLFFSFIIFFCLFLQVDSTTVCAQEETCNLWSLTSNWTNIQIGSLSQMIINLNIDDKCSYVCVHFDSTNLSYANINGSTFTPIPGCSELYMPPFSLNVSTQQEPVRLQIKECCDGKDESVCIVDHNSPVLWVWVVLITLCGAEVALMIVIVTLMLIVLLFTGIVYVVTGIVYVVTFPCFVLRVPNPNEVRSCPHCHVPIYRISGCDHMTCTACSRNFNWREASIVTTLRPPRSRIFSFFSRRSNPPIGSTICGVRMQANIEMNVNNDGSLDSWLMSNLKDSQTQNSIKEEEEPLEDFRCIICSYRRKDWKLSCRHDFCKDCIVKCLLLNKECPICRRKIHDIPTRSNLESVDIV